MTVRLWLVIVVGLSRREICGLRNIVARPCFLVRIDDGSVKEVRKKLVVVCIVKTLRVKRPSLLCRFQKERIWRMEGRFVICGS